MESIAAYRCWAPNLTGPGEPERLAGILGTVDLFRVLGVRPIAGGTWEHEKERQRERIVLLS